MEIILYVIFLALVIYLDYYIAKQFESVAKNKGYTERKYFHLCFWLGLVGYLLVIALPDRGLTHANTTNAPTNNNVSTPKSAPTIGVRSSVVGDKWICGHCKTENSMNYSQCKKCGNFKS